MKEASYINIQYGGIQKKQSLNGDDHQIKRSIHRMLLISAPMPTRRSAVHLKSRPRREVGTHTVLYKNCKVSRLHVYVLNLRVSRMRGCKASTMVKVAFLKALCGCLTRLCVSVKS